MFWYGATENSEIYSTKSPKIESPDLVAADVAAVSNVAAVLAAHDVAFCQSSYSNKRL